MASKRIQEAWWRVIAASVLPVLEVAGMPNARMFPDGTYEQMERWYVGFAAPRGLRDALIMNTLAVDCSPDPKKLSGKATQKQIEEAIGETAKAVSTTVGAIATFTATLAALGVNSGVIATLTTALTTAASVAGPMIGTVGVMAAIIAIFFGALGMAEGKNCTSYFVRGIPVTDDIRRAVALRDAGGRLSDALTLIAPRESTVFGQTRLRPKWVADGHVRAQRELEDWIAAFLRDNDGLPCLWDELCMLRTGFEWLGGDTSGLPLPMRGRRYALAILGGLGSEEAKWLAESPSKRVGAQPLPPRPRVGTGALLALKGKIGMPEIRRDVTLFNLFAGKVGPKTFTGTPRTFGGGYEGANLRQGTAAPSSAPVVGGVGGAVAGGAAGYFLAGRSPVAGVVGAVVLGGVGYVVGNAIAKPQAPDPGTA